MFLCKFLLMNISLYMFWVLILCDCPFIVEVLWGTCTVYLFCVIVLLQWRYCGATRQTVCAWDSCHLHWRSRRYSHENLPTEAWFLKPLFLNCWNSVHIQWGLVQILLLNVGVYNKEWFYCINRSSCLDSRRPGFRGNPSPCRESLYERKSRNHPTPLKVTIQGRPIQQVELITAPS